MPAYLEIEKQTVILPGKGTVVGRSALTGRVAQIDDAWNDPLYEKKRDAKIGGVRSMISVPLMRKGEPIGAIALARNRVEPFTAHEIKLVATFADQAAIAIENVRLFEAEQQRRRELWIRLSGKRQRPTFLGSFQARRVTSNQCSTLYSQTRRAFAKPDLARCTSQRPMVFAP